MSLAESIATKLGGRKCGNGWVIPAICHNPDSSKFNLQISDGANGKLRATCHSRGCFYRHIMVKFEDDGLKDRDTFTPQQKSRFKATQSCISISKALSLEMTITHSFLDARIGDAEKQQDRNYKNIHPEFKPLPPEAWPREAEALGRVHRLSGELLKLYQLETSRDRNRR